MGKVLKVCYYFVISVTKYALNFPDYCFI